VQQRVFNEKSYYGVGQNKRFPVSQLLPTVGAKIYGSEVNRSAEIQTMEELQMGKNYK
jgi:hypothetical protein